jgi:magnesium transporter
VSGVHFAEKLRAFGHHLDLHPLTIEDVMNVWARPRVDINKQELFFTGRAVDIEAGTSHPKGQQVSIVLRKNLVISFSENDDEIFQAVETRLRNPESRIRTAGSSFLAYSLIDTLVDRLLLLTEAVEEIVVEMEESMLNEDRGEESVPLGEIYRRKRQVLRLNRIAFPLRDAIHDLHDLSSVVMDSFLEIYLRDLLDHARRVAERVEHARGMLHDLHDFYSARQDAKINRTMQLLTVIGTIFVPLTFVAGVYGMNFNPEKSPWNMPLLDNYWGYPICLGGMLLFAVTMIVYFRRKGWL